MPVLPDILAPNLSVVFCGTAAGQESAAAGAYYAGRGNRFWQTLFDVGLTPRLLSPLEYREVRKYGIGLTDLAKLRSGADSVLEPSDFDVGDFEAKLVSWAPRAVAFNGKKAASAYYGRDVDYGRQRESVAGLQTFVLPSTSGAAQKYWDESQWRSVAAFVLGART